MLPAILQLFSAALSKVTFALLQVNVTVNRNAAQPPGGISDVAGDGGTCGAAPRHRAERHGLRAARRPSTPPESEGRRLLASSKLSKIVTLGGEVRATFFIGDRVRYPGGYGIGHRDVVPVVEEVGGGRRLAYSSAAYSLRGAGTGHCNVKSVFHYLRQLRDRGQHVRVRAVVVDAELLRIYEEGEEREVTYDMLAASDREPYVYNAAGLLRASEVLEECRGAYGFAGGMR